MSHTAESVLAEFDPTPMRELRAEVKKASMGGAVALLYDDAEELIEQFDSIAAALAEARNAVDESLEETVLLAGWLNERDAELARVRPIVEAARTLADLLCGDHRMQEFYTAAWDVARAVHPELFDGTDLTTVTPSVACDHLWSTTTYKGDYRTYTTCAKCGASGACRVLQRYEPEWPNGEIVRDPDGDYVLYADHVAALTVTDAMVERARIEYDVQRWTLGTSNDDAMRAALTAALGGS